MAINTPELYFYPQWFHPTSECPPTFGDSFVASWHNNAEKDEKSNDHENMDWGQPFEERVFNGAYNEHLEEVDDELHALCSEGKEEVNVAYCAFPAVMRPPLLRTQQHNVLTKSSVVVHRKPKEFMGVGLPQV